MPLLISHETGQKGSISWYSLTFKWSGTPMKDEFNVALILSTYNLQLSRFTAFLCTGLIEYSLDCTFNTNKWRFKQRYVNKF